MEHFFSKKDAKGIASQLRASKAVNLVLLLLLGLSVALMASAAAPNPGHNFNEVGGGAVQGDILYASSADTLAALAKNTTSSRYLSNTGTLNNPAWAQIDLATGVTGTLPAGNGGTANAFTSFTGPTTSTKTFTLPNASATVLTDSTAVTAAQGGTGNASYSIGDLLYASAGASLSKLADIATGNALISGGVTAAPSWGKIGLTTHVSGLLPLVNGGTNKDLLTGLAAGEVLYTDADSAEATAVGLSGQLLQSAGAGAPVWTTATYPATAGTSTNYLSSNGTNFVSTAAPSQLSVLTRAPMATGATTTSAAQGTTLTIGTVGLFNVNEQVTVNQLTFTATIGGTSPSYTVKSCVYSESGASLLIDTTSTATTATGAKSVTVSPAVTLSPGNYYMFLGLATQSGTSPTLTFTTWASTSLAAVNGASIPSGKVKYEGTIASRTSGICPANLFSPGVLTNINNATPVVRLDN